MTPKFKVGDAVKYSGTSYPEDPLPEEMEYIVNNRVGRIVRITSAKPSHFKRRRVPCYIIAWQNLPEDRLDDVENLFEIEVAAVGFEEIDEGGVV